MALEKQQCSNRDGSEARVPLEPAAIRPTHHLEATITGSSGVMLPHLNNVDISPLLYADDLAAHAIYLIRTDSPVGDPDKIHRTLGAQHSYQETKIVTFCSKRQIWLKGQGP